jgi:hypothetical protein
MAINLGNLQLANAFQGRFSTGVVALRQHFVLTDNAATASLQTILLNTQYIDYDQMANNTYVIVHSHIGAAPAFQATVAHFDILGNLEFTLFRLEHIGANMLTFIVTSLLHDDHSAATCPPRSLASFGPPGSRIHFRIPAVAAGAQQGQFLVASMALSDFAAEADPFLVAPAAAAAAAAPAQGLPNDPLVQILQQQLLARGSSRVNATNSLEFARISSYQRVFPAGTFLNTLRLCMIGMPAGEDPSAGYFSTANLVQTLRQIMHTYSYNVPDRTLNITDAKLNRFILLNFVSTDNLSFADFATESDKPITFDNMRTLVARVCDMMATVYGAPLPIAILQCVGDLLLMRTLHAPFLTTGDIFAIVENRIYSINQADAFNPLNPPDGLPPGPKLKIYFTVHHMDEDVHLRGVRHQAALAQAAAVPAAPAAAPQQRSNGRKRGASSTNASSRSVRSAPAAAAAGAVPNARVMRSQLTDWFKSIVTQHPSLNNNMPCLYWLAGKAGHPCCGAAVCANGTNKRLHVTNPEVIAHRADIDAWLARDPAKRF